MSNLLDKRIAFRFPIVVAGAMLAGGRRTASSWFRCAGVKDDWDRFYELLQSVGKDTASLMLPILMFVLRRFDLGKQGYWTSAIDWRNGGNRGAHRQIVKNGGGDPKKRIAQRQTLLQWSRDPFPDKP